MWQECWHSGNAIRIIPAGWRAAMGRVEWKWRESPHPPRFSSAYLYSLKMNTASGRDNEKTLRLLKHRCFTSWISFFFFFFPSFFFLPSIFLPFITRVDQLASRKCNAVSNVFSRGFRRNAYTICNKIFRFLWNGVASIRPMKVNLNLMKRVALVRMKTDSFTRRLFLRRGEGK